MDIVSPAVRSKMMSGIRGRDTHPELVLRSGLFGKGLRFRLHAKLPGKPDLILRRWNAAVFVHGCFWHAHAGCRFFRLPGSRAEFWSDKLLGNRRRDEGNAAKLVAQGWHVIVVWECALRGDAQGAIVAAEQLIRSRADAVHHEIAWHTHPDQAGQISILRLS